jgi:hypothetical protein
MAGHDAELERFRQDVSCAVLLERFVPAWRLDRPQSTRLALKYRRGDGEILIVNHDGRGWWDPLSTAKGDIFALVQFLDPSLNFGEVRKVLQPFIGLSPSFPEAPRKEKPADASQPPRVRWASRPRLRPGTATWLYLHNARALPPPVLDAAARADVVREGAFDCAWFAHRDDGGAVTHVEIRGAGFKGSLRNGHKTLFRFGGGPGCVTRLVVAEAPIDALSVAALEEIRADTVYLATGGGMGPGTIAALNAALAAVAGFPAALFVSATDANSAGERFAARHAELALAAGVSFARLAPASGTDWNDVLTGRKP